ATLVCAFAAAGKHFAADVFHAHVCTATTCALQDTLREVLFAVVDEVMGAQRFGPLQLLFTACGGKDGGSRQASHLDSRTPNTGACGLDEHGMAGPKAPAVDEHVPGGSEGDLARRGVLEADVRRQTL